MRLFVEFLTRAKKVKQKALLTELSSKTRQKPHKMTVAKKTKKAYSPVRGYQMPQIDIFHEAFVEFLMRAKKLCKSTAKLALVKNSTKAS